MQAHELTHPSFRKLTEDFSKVNKTGFITEDLAKVKQADNWSAPMSSEQLDAFLDSLMQ